MPLEAAADRGLKVPLRANDKPGAAVSKEVELYGSSHALVVGIDNYTNGWPRLSNAIADARAVADELRRKGFDVNLKDGFEVEPIGASLQSLLHQQGRRSECAAVRLVRRPWPHGERRRVPNSSRCTPARSRP
ncbi:MAG: caspase family protein [Alphaproteobacteria bacterium]